MSLCICCLFNNVLCVKGHTGVYGQRSQSLVTQDQTLIWWRLSPVRQHRKYQPRKEEAKMEVVFSLLLKTVHL